MPSSSSALIIVQALVLPLYSDEPSNHVSFPNSPACGMVLNIHSRSPVSGSNALTWPGGASLFRGPSTTIEFTTTLLFETNGGETTPYWPLSTGRPSPSVRSIFPSLPNPLSGIPVAESMDHKYELLVAKNILFSSPPSQYATPRTLKPRLVGLPSS